MKKKVVALLLAILSAVNIVNITSIKTEASGAKVLSNNKNIAEAYLGKTPESKGFSSISMGKTSGESYIKYDEKECWLLDVGQGQNKAYIDFSFDTSFKEKGNFDGSVYDIEIEYYDYLEGFFVFYYDGVHEDLKREKEVYLENSKQWKTAKFTLTDAEFSKGVDGKADFRISILGPTRKYDNKVMTSQNSVAIHHVKVTRYETKNPVLASAEVSAPGNSFAWFSDTKEINTILSNVNANPIDAEVTYRLVSDNGNIVFEKTENISFSGNEEKNVTVNVGEVKDCGIYTYEVDVKYPSGNVTRTQKPTKIAILKTDPDGIKNNDVMYASSISRYSRDSIRDGVSVLALSNAYGTRVDMDLMNVFADGVYNPEKNITLFIAEELQKYGMKATGLVWKLSKKENPAVRNYLEIPGGIGGIQGEEQLREWERVLRQMIPIYKGKIDYYEIWNEPNLGNFNYDLTTGDGHAYAKIAEIASDVFAELNPEATVFGPGVTGIGQGEEFQSTTSIGGKVYFDQAMESGMWKKIKNLSFHTYSWGSPSSTEEGTIRDMKQLQTDYINKGAEKPGIWVTEMGFSKQTDFVGDFKTQGAYTCQQLISYKANDVLDFPCTVYTLETNFAENEKEATYGHTEPGDDGMSEYGTLYFPKISFLMITAYNYVMANAEFEKSYNYEDGSIRINKFWSDKFGKNVVTLHSTAKNEYVTMDLGTEHITYYDSVGNSKELNSENGIYTFLATKEPCYIAGDIKDIKVIENYELNSFSETEVKVVENDILQIPLKNKSNKAYTVKVNAPRYVENPDEVVINSGEENVIKLTNIAPKGTEYTIDVDICDGENTVQSSRIKVFSQNGVSAKLTFEPIPGEDVNKWMGVLQLTNLSSATALKGKVAFKSPEFISNYKKVNIGLITPGRTGEVRFVVPNIVKKGMFGFEYDIITENGVTYSFADKTDFTIAKYAKTKPTIDGIAEKGEWYYDSTMYVEDESQIKLIKDWRGVHDLSGRIAIEWDEENMYLFGEVTDDIFSNPTTPNQYWNGDGIQFGVAYEDSEFVAFGETNTTFHEIGIGLFETGAAAYRTGSQQSAYENGLVEGAELAVKAQDGKAVYEMRIPWNKLLKEGQVPKSGEELRFSYLINDNDGSGRRGWIEYTSGIGQTKNNRLFTTIKIID